MDLVEFVELRRAVSVDELHRAGYGRRALERCIGDGSVTRAHRGVVTSPRVPPAHAHALYLGGAVSHTSAAGFYDLPLAVPQMDSHITIPRAAWPKGRPGIHLWWADLRPWEVNLVQRVTSPTRTVLDCARLLPFGQALVVADAAVRRGLTSATHLRRRARRMRGPGSPAARRVAESVDGRSESPLESLQRALHVSWGFKDLEPQVVIEVRGVSYRADFADRRRKILVECEGSTHRSSSGLTSDARRYSALSVDGWLILRFTWAQVMYDPDYVLRTLRAAYASRP